jgi:hypothetical protein
MAVILISSASSPEQLSVYNENPVVVLIQAVLDIRL